MARTKTPAPMRRETSSEYTGKQDRAPNGSVVSEKGANGDAQVAKIGSSAQEPSAGAIQLLICVMGIYGSL